MRSQSQLRNDKHIMMKKAECCRSLELLSLINPGGAHRQRFQQNDIIVYDVTVTWIPHPPPPPPQWYRKLLEPSRNRVNDMPPKSPQLKLYCLFQTSTVTAIPLLLFKGQTIISPGGGGGIVISRRQESFQFHHQLSACKFFPPLRLCRQFFLNSPNLA